MKIFIITLALFFSCFSSQAQDLSKDERKEWKKKQRKMEPEEFYRIVTEYNKLKREEGMAARQVRSMSKEITDKSAEIARLEEELRKLREEGAGEEKTTPANSDAIGEGDNYNKGTVFRVQIGAFKNKDLTKFTEHPRFHAETDADETKKYTIANFRDYWDADLFKKYLREMGVTDAWIVAYRDGQRTDIINVLGDEEVKAIKEAEQQGGDSAEPETQGGDGW